MKKVISIIITVVMLIGIFPIANLDLKASATQDRSYNFYNDYEYNADPGQYMVNIALAQLGRSQSSMGYTEYWCADFVSDCARLAGQTDAIPANSYVPTLWSNIINAGGHEVYDRRAGDIIFYDCPRCDTDGDGHSLEHVGIVVDSTYSIEGNLSHSVKEVSSFSCSKGHTTSSGTITRRYLRPNYQGSAPPSAPTWATLYVNKSNFNFNEAIVFSIESDFATNYTIGINKCNTDGSYNRIHTNTVAMPYLYQIDTVGNYEAYVTAYNSFGYIDSNHVFFSVGIAPSNVTLTTNKNGYAIGEQINFKAFCNNANGYTVGINKIEPENNTSKRIYTKDVSSDFSYIIDEAGEYSAYVSAWSGVGLVDSERVFFSVGLPPKNPVLFIDKNEYSEQNTISFLSSAKYANGYCIGIDKYDESTNSFKRVLTQDVSENYLTKLSQGVYRAYITSWNSFGYADSPQISFAVGTSPKEAVLNINKNEFIVDEAISFHPNAKWANGYTIGINKYNPAIKEYERILTKDIYSSFEYKITEKGMYKAYISAWNTSGLIDSKKITFKVGNLFEIITSEINVSNKILTGDSLLNINVNDLKNYFSNSNLFVSMKSESRMATGTTVNLIDDTDEIYDTMTVVIFGDVNSDGWYDGTDALIVNCLANGLLTREQVGEAVYMAADCNHDGVITADDVTILEQAGVLLANVDQTKSEEELQTDSVYREYINLIDQNPTAEEEITEEPTHEPTAPTAKTFFDRIIEFFRMILDLIRSITVKF